jgi:hypothetical protein
MRVLPILVVTLSVLAGPLPQVLADQQSTAKDVSIIVVPRPDVRREIGNVKVTFSDGHTEVLTHTGDCYDAKVSPKGSVGWIRGRKTIQTGKDSLVVRLPDGATKTFPPFRENVAIMNWRFADDGKTLIIKSMGHHGPSSYAQYDLVSGKVIDSRAGYTPYAKLPPWAKLLADPVADE